MKVSFQLSVGSTFICAGRKIKVVQDTGGVVGCEKCVMFDKRHEFCGYQECTSLCRQDRCDVHYELVQEN